jgi:hypothetical protein
MHYQVPRWILFHQVPFCEAEKSQKQKEDPLHFLNEACAASYSEQADIERWDG